MSSAHNHYLTHQPRPGQPSSRPLPTPGPSTSYADISISGYPPRRSSPVKFPLDTDLIHSDRPSSQPKFVPHWKRALPSSPAFLAQSQGPVRPGNTSPVRFFEPLPVKHDESNTSFSPPGHSFPHSATPSDPLLASRARSASPERRPLPSAPGPSSTFQTRPLSAFHALRKSPQRASTLPPTPEQWQTVKQEPSQHIHQQEDILKHPSPKYGILDLPQRSPTFPLSDLPQASPTHGILDLPQRSPTYGILDLPQQSPQYGIRDLPQTNQAPSAATSFPTTNREYAAPLSHGRTKSMPQAPISLSGSPTPSPHRNTVGLPSPRNSALSSLPPLPTPPVSIPPSSFNTTETDPNQGSLTLRLAKMGLSSASSSSNRPTPMVQGSPSKGGAVSSPNPHMLPQMPANSSTNYPIPPTVINRHGRSMSTQLPQPPGSSAHGSAPYSMSRESRLPVTSNSASRFVQPSILAPQARNAPELDLDDEPPAGLISRGGTPSYSGKSEYQRPGSSSILSSPSRMNQLPRSYTAPRQQPLPTPPSLSGTMSGRPPSAQSFDNWRPTPPSAPISQGSPTRSAFSQGTQLFTSSGPKPVQQSWSQPVAPPLPQSPRQFRHPPPSNAAQPHSPQQSRPSLPSYQSTGSAGAPRRPPATNGAHSSPKQFHPPLPQPPAVPPIHSYGSPAPPSRGKTPVIQSPKPQVPPIISLPNDEESPSLGPSIQIDCEDDASGPMISVSGPDISISGEADQQGPKPPSGLRPTITRSNNPLTCGGCGNIISYGRTVNAMGVRWHPDCFRCCKCETLLEHISSYEGDGRAWCHLDYHEQFAPRCYHCKTPIVEERFISLDDPALGKRAYHEQHFFCAECGDPFLDPSSSRIGALSVSGDGDFADDDVGFTVYRGHPYCEACHVRLRMPKCKKCKKSIREGMQAVEALGGKWCYECFVCKHCERPFENPSFFERDGDPFCEHCYSVMLRNEI